MTSGDPTPNPSPTSAEVLRWCAAAAPKPWFPSDHAKASGTPRDALDEPLWSLVRSGLLRVADWVRGRGQGFVLTPAGEEAVAGPKPAKEPTPLPTPVPPPPFPPVRDPADDLPVTTFDRGEAARNAFFDPPTAVVAPLLLAANVLWFVAGLWQVQQAGADPREYLRGENVAAVLKQGAVFGPYLAAGEWWRLAASGFAHFGLLHLALNAVGIAVLGPLAEGLWGRWRFAAIYIAAAVGGACAAAANSPLGATAGASGAVWGLMFAIVAWLLLYREHLPPQAVRAWARQLMYAVLINAAVSTLPSVSWEAHVGGGVVGFATAVLLDLLRTGRGWKRPVLGAVGLVVLAAAVGGGLWAAVRYSEPWRAVRVMNIFARLVPGVTVQLKELPPGVAPESVRRLHTSATEALIARTPTLLDEARAATRDLGTAADAFTALASDRQRAYLAEIRRFVELLRPLLDAGEVPTAEQWKALADQLAAVETAWPVAKPE